jgi:D-aminopeptidase
MSGRGAGRATGGEMRERGMRVLVSVDMEGAAAVVDAEDVSPGTGEYERSRRPLTEEANAAVRGVRGMLAGDDTVAAEAADVAPGMHAVVVKRAPGGRAAALLHPEEARARIEREVPLALADRAPVRAPRFDGPLALEVDVLKPYMTERAQLVPGVELAGGCALRYAAPDFPSAYRVPQVITMLGGI